MNWWTRLNARPDDWNDPGRRAARLGWAVFIGVLLIVIRRYQP